MVANIARIEGTDQAWYADKAAWHNLGTVTPGARTAKQVVKAVPMFQREVAAKAHVAEMNALQDVPIAKPKLWLPLFTEVVVPMPEDAGDRMAHNRQEARDAIAGLFEHSKSLVGVPNSAYRAYQAVAEYADHYRPLRIGADTPTAEAADKRFRSITEGPAADMKARALEWLRGEFLTPPEPAKVLVPARRIVAAASN